MTAEPRSDSMKNLVQFMIVLAILAAIAAFAVAMVIGPALHGGFPPTNGCWGFSC